jgi:hypothetical protein
LSSRRTSTREARPDRVRRLVGWLVGHGQFGTPCDAWRSEERIRPRFAPNDGVASAGMAFQNRCAARLAGPVTPHPFIWLRLLLLMPCLSMTLRSMSFRCKDCCG